MKHKPTLIFAALCLAWGSTWIASDALAGHIPLLWAAAIRYLLASAFCLPLLPRHRVRPCPRAFLSLLLVSLTLLVLPLLLLRWARPQLPSATVVVLYAAMPLVVILLTPVLGGREAPPAALHLSVAGLAGLLVATGATFSLPQTAAAAAVLLAVVSTAASSLLAQRLQQHPAATAAWVLGMAGLALALAALLWEQGQPLQWSPATAAWLLLVATAGGAPAYTAWFWLLRQRPAYQVATVAWIEPLVALAESALLLRMGLSWTMLLGAALTLLSCLGLFRKRRDDDQSVSLLGI